MHIREVIEKRRTVHEYDSRPLPPGLLEQALEAALSAPNHGLTEPWRFVRAGPGTRGRLLALGIELATDGGARALSRQALARLVVTVENPAELLIVTQLIDDDPRVEQEDYAAVACAIQNLTLIMWAEGVGSKWSTSDMTKHPSTYAVLGLDPERQRIVGFLWFGYPLRADAPKPRRRRSLQGVLTVLP